MTGAADDRERVLVARGDELTALLHHADTGVLLALLDNPSLDEAQVCILLERKNLPAEVLEETARRKPLLKSYRIKRGLAFHPKTPRLVTLRLLRDLYLMDLVQLTLLPGIPTELKLNAEDQLISRLPQLPLGQKITLARRGPGRLAGALLAEGHAQIISIVLDNSFLTEANILKVLSREKLPPGVVVAVAHHRKWSLVYNIRLALVRHPAAPLSSVLAFLPELTVSDLRELASPGIVTENLRKYLEAEVRRRMHAKEKRGPEDTSEPLPASNDS
ncbi:MAG TPA: hypothetical protein VE077_14190 [Candidatus Methylomirabilis sp.]|nr:hypothetical protein [Candidatus Methylomirabilis sp.]